MNHIFTLKLLLCGLLATVGLPATAQPPQEQEQVPQGQEQTETAVRISRSNLRQTHQAAGLIFQTPTGFSEVQVLRNNTVGVVSEDQRLTIKMMPLAPETLAFLNMEGAELMNYVKYFFLGINSPSSNYPQRRFFNRSVTGELQIKRNNRGFAMTEIYLVPLSAGHKVAIAFEADDLLPIMQVEETINTVAKSLQEDPEVVAERIKKQRKKSRRKK